MKLKRGSLFFSLFQKKRQAPRESGRSKKVVHIKIDKRQKFILGVLFLSLSLFITEFQFNQFGFFISFGLSFLTSLTLWWAIREDLKNAESDFPYSVFILPFFYTLAFSLFYFVAPARLLSRVLLTGLYAFGLYSLFLCQNIFTVGAIRTIALLSGAKIVSFVLTLLSFFFLTNIIFTLHLSVIFLIPLIALVVYPLTFQSLWTYYMQKTTVSLPLWALALTVCVLEVATMLWFWPSSPTVIALFMTGFLYTIVGLSHVWLDRRLFRGVLWEYVWVGAVVFFVLVLFTSWGK